MSGVRVTLSANAGVSLELGGYKVLVDAYSESAEHGFSALTKPLLSVMIRCEAFQEPDVICCTHCHADHYSDKLVDLFYKLYPVASLLLPEKHIKGQILIRGKEFVHTLGDLTLRFLRLPHEGEQYADVAHYGLIVSVPGCNVLLSGDCAVAAPELAEAVGDTHIDLAIMDFPWACLKKGKQYLESVLKPDRLLLYHLPFAEDDKLRYREAAALARKKSSVADTRLLWNPLQTEIYEW